MLVLAALLTLLFSVPQREVDGFVSRTHKGMPYRLFVPPSYDTSHKYPLVIWLHGSGSAGNDNFKQISGASLRGSHTWTIPGNQARHPSFVLAPQAPAGRSWISEGERVLEVIDAVRKEFSIDESRIYIAGQSMGAYGAWNLITRRPDLFAAAVPLCGGGDPSRAARIANIPIWAFHGDADRNVPVSETRAMIAAIKRAGGSPRYTEYKGVGHEIWFRVFQEPELVDWIFAQHK